MESTLQHKNPVASQKTSHNESQYAKSYPSRTIVHAKLYMTEPGDHDEREADAMADAVVSGGKISRKISSGANGGSSIAVSQQMESQLSQLQGGGRQMPDGLRDMMESGFGQDFSHVRIHTDSEAANMSSSIHAKAFTLGNDIYFNQGQFSPNTSEGQKLMAHELTHVVQGSGKVGRDEEDINSLIIDAISDEEKQSLDSNTPGGYLAYANEFDIKTRKGIGPLRSGGKHSNSGPKCNIFVLNMLYDAYMKQNCDKDTTTAREEFVNYGLYRRKEKDGKTSYKTLTVSNIYDNIIDNKSALKRIESINDVKPGDIVIWTSMNGKSDFQEKPYHIEIVNALSLQELETETKTNGKEQKSEEVYVLKSIGAHNEGVAEKLRYVGREERVNEYKRKNATYKINTIYYSYQLKNGKKNLDSPIEFYRFTLPINNTTNSME